MSHGMSPYHEADNIRLFLDDARAVMRSLPAESVSCIMTSPPFWGLRSYSCEPSIWGGDPNCPHRLEAGAIEGESYAGRQRWQHDGVSRQETPDAWVKGKLLRRSNDQGAGQKQATNVGSIGRDIPSEHATCSLCGAWRGQLGLEPTVQLYIEHTMEWLREAKRVLRKDGVAWIDLGDSRGGSWGNYAPTGKGGQRPKATERWERKGQADVTFCPPTARVLPKSLCLIPQRIAIACQDEGWIVRNYVIIKTWMPESADDRMTRNYRVLLMLVKNNKPLYYWNEHTGRMADRPPVERVEGIDWEWQMKHKAGQLWGSRKHSYWHGEDYWYDAQAVRQPSSGQDGKAADFARLTSDHVIPGQVVAQHRLDRVSTIDIGLRNLGDIWDDLPCANWPSGPGFEHFATFCVEEPERCIKASVPAEICVKCGKPRVRIVKKANVREHPQREGRKDRNKADFDGEGYAERESGLGLTWDEQTIGWTDCGCGCGFESATVLDPFIGTGTTAVAARMLGRKCIGIDASEDYLRQAVTRLTVGDSGIRRMVAARRQGARQGVML